MASSSLRDRKQVQDARFDSNFTGVKKDSFIGSRKQQHITMGFQESVNKVHHVKKGYSVKTKSTVSFISFQLWSTLETGHCVCLEVFSILPPFVLVKKKTLRKAKKLFKVSLLSLSKDSLVNCFWENLSFCQFILVFNCDLR